MIGDITTHSGGGRYVLGVYIRPRRCFKIVNAPTSMASNPCRHRQSHKGEGTGSIYTALVTREVMNVCEVALLALSAVADILLVDEDDVDGQLPRAIPDPTRQGRQRQAPVGQETRSCGGRELPLQPRCSLFVTMSTEISR